MRNQSTAKNPNLLIINRLGFLNVECVRQLSNNVLDDLSTFYEIIVALDIAL